MNKNEIEEKLKSAGLHKASKLVCSLANDCIRLQTTSVKEEEIKIGETKIGGCPDLPDDVQWPTLHGKLLPFLAQINLAEFNRFADQKDLPKSGWIYFFYEFDVDHYGHDPKEKDSWRVLHVACPPEKLSRRRPSGVDEKEDMVYGSCRVSFYKAVSVPGWDIVRWNVPGLKDADRNKYDQFLDTLLQSDPCEEKHQIFGFPVEVQGDMRGECEIYSRGLDYDKVRKLKQSEIKDIQQNAERWGLLFQLDSDDKANMMWGDCGRLYFWVRGEDLPNHNFENIWMILQYY